MVLVLVVFVLFSLLLVFCGPMFLSSRTKLRLFDDDDDGELTMRLADVTDSPLP